jgi:hypothetical protein
LPYRTVRSVLDEKSQEIEPHATCWWGAWWRHRIDGVIDIDSSSAEP